MNNFKFKVGDIVKVYSDYWSRNGVLHKTYICVILAQKMYDGEILHGGVKGVKYPYYSVQYAFDVFGNTTDKSETSDISLLEEYWFITDNLEVAKETNVVLNEQFIYRAFGHGVYLNEQEAKNALYGIKHDGSRILMNIIKSKNLLTK